MDLLTLNCWVRSQSVATDLILVDISKTDTVSDLKTAIKNEFFRSADHINEEDLTLYKPKNPVSGDNLHEFILSEHGEKLRGYHELSRVFPEQPDSDGIHVIVDAPSGIFCWKRGDNFDNGFQLQIRPGQCIDELIPDIKNSIPEFNTVAERMIHFYKASRNDDKLRVSLHKDGDGELLRKGPLAPNFLDIPVLDPLRVIVEVSPRPIALPSDQKTQMVTSKESADIRQRLARSFQTEYCGAAVEGFYEYLTRNEGLFKKGTYYAKFCSVVQSSGTGKSRMLVELYKKGVIVIYMNLRAEDDAYSFPPRDIVPSNILTNFPATGQEYRMACFGFFTALFNTLATYLSRTHVTRNSKSEVMDWVEKMCDMDVSREGAQNQAREEFFENLWTEYSFARDEVKRVPHDKAQDGSDPKVSELADERSPKRAKISGTSAVRSRKMSLPDRLSEAYRKMITYLNAIFPDHGNKPKLVIAIDEAHSLTGIYNGYCPSHMFCSIVSEYSLYDPAQAIWVAFTSTTSDIGNFYLPKKYDSHRFPMMGYLPFPHYIQLGWDASAWPLGEVEPENVSQLCHIVGFGRPLWESLRLSFGKVDRVLSIASSKLRGRDHYFDLRRTSHVLAVLGQRFVLNVALGHPESITHLEEGVASHMRVCLATTINRAWRFTNYPSEPLLSCVAADCLHSEPGRLASALDTLVEIVDGGMVDQGERGELASRLLWLLAKDLFIRTRPMKQPTEWDDHLMDCQMISVVDWLEFVFGPRIWNGDDARASLAYKSFKDAYINFSHWISTDIDISGLKDGKELSLNDLMLCNWYRTSAVQCHHPQARIDKMIPVYMKDSDGSAPKTPRLTQILISDRVRKSKNSKNALNVIARRNDTVGGDEKPVPYIGIMADLGQPPSFSMTFPGREIDDRCLRIYAAGVDETTYPFLANYPELMKALQDLVRIQQAPEMEWSVKEYLDAQVKFGNRPNREHMVWEEWKKKQPGA